MKKKPRVPVHGFRLLPIPLAAAALCGPLPALAQDAPPAGAIELDEITVTATRRAEGVQDIPINISAVNGDEIERQGITDLAELMRVVPGIFLVDQGPRASNLMTVRGLNVSALNASEFLANGSGGVVATYVGDIPLYVDLKLLDMDRVEVLLGPQGTLYGAGTLGGAIRYIPNRPDPNATQFSIDGSVYARSHSEGLGHETTLVANVPLVRNKLALRTAVGYFNDPGFIDYNFLVREPGVSDPEPDLSDPAAVAANLRREADVDDEQTLSARVALGFTPSDAFDAMLAYYFQNQDVGGRTVNHDQLFGTGRYANAYRFTEPNERENHLLSLELHVDFAGAELTSATGVSQFEEQGQRDQTDLLLDFEYGYETFPSFVAFTRETSEEKQFTQELRLVSTGDGPFTWIGGVFYNRFELDATSSEFVPGFPDFAGIDQPSALEYFQVNEQTFTESALFGEIGYRFTPQFQATVGARWFEFEDDQRVGFAIPLIEPDPPSVQPEFRQARVTDDDVILKYNMSYRFDEDVLGYFTWSEGYRVGGVNPIPVCDGSAGQNVCVSPEQQLFKPDKTVNTEFGLRSALLDRRVVLNLAAYEMRWRDVQVDGVSAGGGVPIIVNGPKALTKGVEASLRARLTERLTATLNFSHNDARLSEDSPNIPGRNGDRLPGSPRNQGNLLLSFVEPLSNGWRIEADYGMYVVGSVATRAGGRETDPGRELQAEELKGFTLHNASVGVAGADWHLRLYATNLFDEYAETGARQNRTYLERRVDGGGNDFSVRRYHKDVVDPLAVGLRFGYQFTI